MNVAYKMSHSFVNGEWQPVWRLYGDEGYQRDFIGSGRALIAEGYRLASAANWGEVYVAEAEMGETE